MHRLILIFATACGTALAQEPVGKVGMQDATVQGALEVRNGQAILIGNTTVTAQDHAAEIALNRGGTVRICATSGLHVTAGKSTSSPEPLMLALDRGAIEVKMPTTTSDVIRTPDLRFTARGNGTLDLQLRVTRNGDTCVENRGTEAPTLNVADQFGEASYELRPGQHVLFEHGSLKEVVDHETSSCGCPPEPTMTVADALIHSGAGANNTADAAKSEDQHPFPAAVSAGLAPPSAIPQQSQPGVVHSQVSATLTSNGSPDSTSTPPSPATTAASTSSPATAPAAPATTVAPPPTQTSTHGGVFHSVGHFFRRLFGGS